MTENIELRSYCITQSTENDSEEYHEINQDAVNAENISTKCPESSSTQIKFFTHYMVGNSKKKKKVMKKMHHRSKNIMEIINFEVGHINNSPIIENVLNVVEKNHQASYLQRKEKKVEVKPFLFDMEHGLCKNLRNVKLTPSFPNVEKVSEIDDKMFVHYVQPYMFEDIVCDTFSTDSKQTEKFLDISVNGIKFTHHHEFSLEHILILKLEEYYEKYIINEKIIKETLHALNVKRQTRENLKEKFTTISPKKKDDIRFDPTILKYTAALLEYKEEYFKKIKERRELINTLISIWSDIKNIRQKLNAYEMSHILIVKKIALSAERFSKDWNNVFHAEYSDMLIKYEYDYITKYLNYKRSKSNDSGDKNILTNPKLQINPEEIKMNVEKIVDIILKPEDFVLTLQIDKSLLKETSNRNLEYVKSETHIYFKVYVDDFFVCESEHVKVEDFSKIDYNDSLILQILQSNKKLGLILCENNEEVSALTIDMNEIRKKSSSAEFTHKDFIYYDKIVKPTTEFVGSGFSIKDIATVNKIRLRSSNVFKGKLYTTCKIKLKIAWNDKLNKNQSSCMKQSMIIENQIKRLINGTDKPNLNKLVEIINNIYDYEIEDASIVTALKDFCNVTIKKDDTVFSDEGVDDIRFKLLNLRNNGGFSKIANKTIPLYQSQITTEQLSSLQKSEENDFDVEYFESKRVDNMDLIDLQRYMGQKFVEKLNLKLLTDLNERLLRRTHKDVVMDYRDLSLRSIFSNKSNLSLGTSSSVTRKKAIDEGLTTEQEIQITILRAFNLFDRSTEDADQENEDCNIVGYKVRSLRPFVRLNYHGESVQTPTAIGCNPTWNYTAKIKTKLEPLSSIYINIYDEHKVNISLDSEETSQSFRYRCYNKWLGSLAIPINTVLSLGSLRGTFKITSPPIVFGYESGEKESTSIIPEIKRLMRKDSAFLTLRITTSLSHLGGLQFYYQPTDTDDHVIRHLNKFVTEYLNDFPTRNLSLTFTDSAGKNKCVTEFIQPLPLPEIILVDPKRTGSASKSSKSSSSKRTSIYGVEETVFELDGDISRMLAIAVRYVSLIPTYEVMQSRVITLLGIELLRVLHGTPLDHTLLLASYFIALGVKCWVVIGHGLPRGLSSYVMVKYHDKRIVMATDREIKGFLSKEEYEVFIFDAVSGDKHDVRDVGCPLKTVGYVFDNENIWVNMQTCQDCEKLSFDFKKSSNWQSVFNTSVFVLKQADITTNVYSAPGDVANLRNNLETKLKAKIQKWRWNIKTIWNRYLSNVLRESLPYWEYWSFNPTTEKPALGAKLKQLLVSYKIFGFPINIPYVNTKSVISRVKSTMLHLNDDPRAEFALGLEVFAYPSNVLSVWVFLASIART